MEDSENQKYCLKWNNFHNNLMAHFGALKEDQDFVDVTLSCNGHHIKAHKVVLSACSPYLKSIFKDHPSKHPIVILENLSFNHLEAVIQFVYTGEVYVKQTELFSFLKVAETLQIKALSESSANQNLMETNLPPKNDNFNVVSNKRLAEVDTEYKKLPSKKVRRVSTEPIKEVSEIKAEKDCFNNNDSYQEQSFEAPSMLSAVEPHLNIIENNVDQGMNFPPGDEEYIPNDFKKPHWLDPRSCPLCNRTYSNLSNLKQHIKLIHNPTLATCKICYKTFKSDLYLRRHIIGYHEVNLSGNNLGPVDFKFVPNQCPVVMPTIKPDPDSYNQVYNENQVYQPCE